MKKLASFSLASGITLLLLSSCEKSIVDPPPPPTTSVDSVKLIKEVIAEPQECAVCHPNHFAEWETSMHAYAMADPVFIALNDIGQQRSNNQLDQFCTKCHSPFAPLLGETPPGFDPGSLSPLSASAIHCDVCHTMKSFSRGAGIKTFHLDRTRRGPIADPQPNSFHEAAFDNAYNFSGICSPCHDVISPDGSMFVETTNAEWDASPYSAMGLECQGCHMPTYSGQAAMGGPQRDNLHRHTFVGVDYPLTDFPGKNNTIEMVRELLQNSVTVTVNAPAAVSVNEQFTVSVTINNDKTGHDIPSGNIFDRQMWIALTVKDAINETVYFATGMLDDNGDLRNHHSEYVANGLIARDTSLALFNGTPYDAHGEETLFFWEATSAEKNTIAAFRSHTSQYRIEAPSRGTTLELSVQLRFRSFPPYLLRTIGREDLLPELIIFDMDDYNQTIAVTN
jgi:hypothetical protein